MLGSWCTARRYREIGKKRGKLRLPEAEHMVENTVPAIVERETLGGRPSAARHPRLRHRPAMAPALPSLGAYRMHRLRQAVSGQTPAPWPSTRAVYMRRLGEQRRDLLRFASYPQHVLTTLWWMGFSNASGTS
jgi:hypothetical protein